MNEQIKLLAEQAGALEVKTVLNTPVVLSLNGDEIEKFAELLVRECAQVAATVVIEREGVEFGLIAACCKHFGVDVETCNVTNYEQQGHTCPYLEEIHGDYTTLCDCTPEQEHECARDI